MVNDSKLRPSNSPPCGENSSRAAGLAATILSEGTSRIRVGNGLRLTTSSTPSDKRSTGGDSESVPNIPPLPRS